MKVSIRQDKLKAGLSIIDKIASASISLPILNNVLIETVDNLLKLSATNLETGIQYRIRAKVSEQGKVAVPARVLSSFVNYLSSSTLEIQAQNNILSLESGEIKTKMNGVDPEEFPIIPEVEKNEFVSIQSSILNNGLSQVAKIASPSSIKPEISGIYFHFEKNLLTMAATDSFRLAEKKFRFSEPFNISKSYEFILPGRAASFLKSVLDSNDQLLNVFFSPNLLMIEPTAKDNEGGDSFCFVSKLVEGRYPDYKEIIPKKLENEAKIDRKDFLAHLRRASLFASRINEVKVKFLEKENKIEVFCQNPELGEYSSLVPAEIKGKDAEVSFNYKFLIDGLSGIYENAVTLGLSYDDQGEEGPAIIQAVDDDSYLYVVMPIQPA